MAMTEYDKEHLEDILNGQGDWFNARLLRCLNELLGHADFANRAILTNTYPEQCEALFAYHGESAD